MLLVKKSAAAAAGSEAAFAEMADSLDLVEGARSELERKLSAEASSSSKVLSILNNMAELASESALRSASVRNAAVRVDSSMGKLIDSSSQGGERIELIRGSLGAIELRIEAMRELGTKNEADVAAVAELVESFGSRL